MDPTDEVCERHLRLLREVGDVAAEVTRVLGAAAVAAAGAVEEAMSDTMWQPETGRARALAGAKYPSGEGRLVGRRRWREVCAHEPDL